MEKKALRKLETLLFVFSISFIVFILLFITIFTVISIVKKYKKGEISLLRGAREPAPDAANRGESGERPVEAVNPHPEDAAETADSHWEANRALSQRQLH